MWIGNAWNAYLDVAYALSIQLDHYRLERSIATFAVMHGCTIDRWTRSLLLQTCEVLIEIARKRARHP